MRTLWIAGASALAAAGLTYAAFAPGALTINGNTVQTSYTTVNGKTYVPLADVAKALNFVVVKKDGGYELAASSGANQAEGTRGKVGQTLNAGIITFQVKEVIETDSYECEQRNGTEHPLYDAKDKLVVVKIKIKNARAKPISLDTWGGELTALTDTEDHSFTTHNLDGQRGPDLLPGAAVDFALIYEIPKKAAVGDYVYQAHVYMPDKGYKDLTFRISTKAD